MMQSRNSPLKTHPATLATPWGYVGTFSISGGDLYDHLIERHLTAGGWVWVDHGQPSGNFATTTTPAAVALPWDQVSVFTLDADNHLEENASSPHGWTWNDHGSLLGGSGIVGRHLSAIAAPGGYVGVFAVVDNGHLIERNLGTTGGWVWVDHGAPPNSAASSNLGPVALAAPSGYVGVFTPSRDGRLEEKAFSSPQGWTWHDRGTPPGTRVNSIPAAVATPSGYVGVFTIGENRHLIEGHFAAGGWEWADHGTPPGGGTYHGSSAFPSAVAAPSGYVGVFLVSDNGHLIERHFAAGSWEWADHGLPPGTTAPNAPSAIAASGGYVGVFLIGDNGHLIERHLTAGGWEWADHGTP